ncbi:MAG: hypothetical protein A2504_05435 [Bdellovibrionales bacterium RIFOXYD12_FULL_39_22]|nr:MAG: hypothetical protein A2385_06390 [Bdellovibrionales bacterium RIFOXYB1_FULL_39_21]OFZ41907.1 MAG: hypothetical protein A2485_08360 [Bdellovibrionales bacterium RIFOXYC12_FULL_39_17]OFZ50623.1 MAG: hypothetical protein A2404_05310 [Bdellovibrionales bacterium RIFOXYC1_FULL_39_130]OFZ77846.1 MAG: hypothetical protein A2560_00480 [Bdellovibrionales bacterium RIFOXYD1_FULL_39_84]OFZ93718.1 MAG: hypothetical protein A2504_05435 [Bdellovibrionales bacterium RIFOXYD12_FULL_39_22]HLE11598.1 ou
MKIFYAIVFFLLAEVLRANTSSFIPATFSAEFDHVQKSTLSGREKIDPGSLKYRYPSNIRFEFLGKNKITFVSNPKTSWYYTAPVIKGEAGSLSQENTTKSGPVKFFDILKNGLSNNSNYSVIAENGHYVLQLNDALKKEMGIAKAILVFAEGKSDFSNIKSIELNYVNKNPVTLKFKSITKDVTLADSNFSFEAPTNTLINH